MTAAPVTSSRRRRGRPSVAAERRVEIVDAYIALVAETSTAEIPAAAIAERAGVARTAIAHFVGDRTALRIAATEEIGRRYESTIRSAWTDETPEALIAVPEPVFAVPVLAMGLGLRRRDRGQR